MAERVCPRPACAELNPPDADECETCGTRLVFLRLGDLQHRGPSVMDDPAWQRADQVSWDQRKALSEATG